MATVQKSTFRRFNGIDWDTIYFSTSADIAILGVNHTIAKDETGFNYGDVLESSDTIFTLLTKTIDHMTTLEKERIAALETGSGVTAISADKITGTISYANLPEDVAGATHEVPTEDAKNALTATQVKVGDIVKVTGGGAYTVRAIQEVEGVKKPVYTKLTDESSGVAWSRLTGVPTTVDGMGLTDALKDDDVAVAGGADAAGKIAQANGDGKLAFDITGSAATLDGKAPSYFATADAHTALETRMGAAEDDIAALDAAMNAIDASQITTGTIAVARLPKVALSELHIVTDYAAMENLTTEQVQLGDTVKIADTLNDDGSVKVAGGMYYVADVTKLGTADWEDAFVQYTAGAASAVEWSGVMHTPTTLAGYGITDAVNTTDLANTGGATAANKVAQANAEGKLDFDITGSAAKLGGQEPAYYATKDSVDTLQTDYNETKSTVADLVSAILGDDTPGGGGDTPAPSLKDRLTDLETLMGTKPDGYASNVMADLAALKAGTAVTALDAAKITGKLTRTQLPADISGRIIEKADMAAVYTLTTAEASIGDLIVLPNGQVYGVKDDTKLDSADGYKLLVDVGNSEIAWTQIKSTPTTLAGYGITDAVNTADVINDGIVTDTNTLDNVKGKLVKVGADGKLHVDIAGDAATLGGQEPSYYATSTRVEEIALNAPVMIDSVDDFVNPKVGQMVIVPAAVTTTPDPDPENP